MGSMVLNILAFGAAKDAVNGSTVEFTVDINGDKLTASELKKQLLDTYPSLNNLPAFMLAVNSVYATDKTYIKSGDEVAIIPPTSGG
jgi:molybdopterin converting factor small subunit